MCISNQGSHHIHLEVGKTPMPSVLKLRLALEMFNHCLNERALFQKNTIKRRQRFRGHVLSDFVNQVHALSVQLLRQLLVDIPLIGVKFAINRLRQLDNGMPVILIARGQLNQEEFHPGIDNQVEFEPIEPAYRGFALYVASVRKKSSISQKSDIISIENSFFEA